MIATQNPIELEGTYALPEAQLDRFLMRLGVGYPDPEEEVEILARRRRRREDAVNVAGVISRAELAAMQVSVEDVHVAGVIERYIVDLVQATRADHRVALGASPRGHSRCSSSPGRSPRSGDATSSCPTTSRRWRSPRSPTGSC